MANGWMVPGGSHRTNEQLDKHRHAKPPYSFTKKTEDPELLGADSNSNEDETMDKVDLVDPPSVTLNNESSLDLPQAFLEECVQLADFVLMQEQAPLNAIVSVTLVGDDEIANMNLEYRKKEGATDVLAFPVDGGKNYRGAAQIAEEIGDDDPNAVFWAEFNADENAEPLLLGDVVIAPEVAAKQAVERLDLEAPYMDALDLDALQMLVTQRPGTLLHDSTSELAEAVFAELRLLLVHGMLHLVGYDHEANDEDAEAMEVREKEILADWDEFSQLETGVGGGCIGNSCG